MGFSFVYILALPEAIRRYYNGYALSGAINRFIERRSAILAVLCLALMFALGATSMAKDSAIVDEVAHIPAGYSYLKYGDYRLNPEHPPLIKELAAAPLQFMKLQFPTDIAAWTTAANGQWDAGWNFIYHYGNDASRIIFWARMPVLLLAIAFGGFIYFFTRKHFGPKVALLATFLYAFEPNIMAHARLVTTDVGVAVFIFLALAAFWRWLKSPSWLNLGMAGVALALAQLAKFSAVLLVPFMGLIALIWIVASDQPKKFWARFWRFGLGLLGIFVIGFGLVWVFYFQPTHNLTKAKQDQLIEASLPGGWQRVIGLKLETVNSSAVVRPMSQYVLGLLMVFTRVAGGNTTYFLGQVTNQSFKTYFPITYAVKTPIPLEIMIGLAALGGVWLYLRRKPIKVWANFKTYAKDHLIELSLLLWVLFYGAYSVNANLDLGIRHLMPIIPPILVLVSIQIVKLSSLKSKLPKKVTWIGLGLLLVWYLAENLMIYPHYLAYFNELIGGPANAYKYVSDSSVDWGQDLLRLQDYVKANPEITKIAVDYFGGGEPRYYFCDRKFDAGGQLIKTSAGYDCSNSVYLEWHAQSGVPPTKYIAVSETFLMDDIYYANLRHDQGYAWLRDMKPIAKIGYSIYVYKLP